MPIRQPAIAHFLDSLDNLSDWFAGLIIVCNFAPCQPLLAEGFSRSKPEVRGMPTDVANGLLASRLEDRRNAVICDLAYLASRTGSAEFFSGRLATILQPYSPAGFQLLADDWAELCRVHFRGPAKCIVLDCDNTLWGGIVGEDGIAWPPPRRDVSGRLLSAIPTATEAAQANGLSADAEQQE